jgi:circadian clock protein KaiC
VLEAPPLELVADVVGDRLLAALDRLGARRVVIDSLDELVRVVAANGDEVRVPEYLTALQLALRSRGVTSLLLGEVLPALDGRPGYAIPYGGAVPENLLLLREAPQGGEVRQLLTVRYAPRDAAPHPFAIGPAPHGLRLLPAAGAGDGIPAGSP